MTRSFLAAIAALLLVLPALAQTLPHSGAQPGPDDRAKQWLTLVDDANYSESTRQLAPQAKKTDIAALRVWREPLGAVSSRSLKDVKLSSTNRGMARGQYAVVRYDSSFAHRANVLETVTLVLNKGAWAVVGYRID